ncbi:hypothetical protein TcasGA2_TC008592 [Tribolium castaneum]|uniref:Double jelly roll-like domain-containing protein n=1 Tax=Tribolium castaneum TaxID=7070 RepID=D7EIE0_TRICA|nr:hypothetical protein TcasGA2_TC008592 [Tribolium castaneum]
MSASKLQVYSSPEIDDSISKEEEHTYSPQVRSFDNNDEIEIIINQRDIWISLFESFIQVDGEFIPDPVPETGGGNVTLTNNAAAYLFENVSYELNNVELDSVREVGTVSTIKTFLCYGKDEVRALTLAGWNDQESQQLKTFNETDNTFSFRIPLSYLLNLPFDYHRIVSGHQKLRLIRSRNDANCFISTGTRKATLKINNIELKAKHVYPNDEIKLTILEGINKDRVISLPFRKWEIHELPSVRQTNNDIWRVKTSTQLERPRFIIVCFQTNRKNNPKSDVTLFDHCDVRSVRLWLNSNVYPYETWKLQFAKNKYLEAYQAYVDFYKEFNGKDRAEPILSYTDYTKRPIFVLDCSKQNEAIRSSTIDISLEFESDNNFPADTRAYCIIIHDRIMQLLSVNRNN